MDLEALYERVLIHGKVEGINEVLNMTTDIMMATASNPVLSRGTVATGQPWSMSQVRTNTISDEKRRRDRE
jgi:hypothetical protein